MPANLPFPLASGTILHFRSFGLKINNHTPPPSQRYWRIDKELGRGNLPVYRVTPLRLESETESEAADSDLEVDPEEELSEGQSGPQPRSKEALDKFGKRIRAESKVDVIAEGEGELDFGKRKRTETSESEKAADLLAITKAPTTVRNARGQFTSTSRTTKKAKGKSSTIVRVPTVSEASDKTVKAPTLTSDTLSGSAEDSDAIIEPSHTAIETPGNIVVETPVNTANPLPFVEALSIAADAPKTVSGTPSTSAEIEVEPTRPLFFESSGEARAIKVKCLKAETYHHSQGLGQLGEEFDKGLSLAAVAESVVSPMMAGWVQILLPGDTIWYTGLFSALMMPVYEEFHTVLGRAADDEVLPLFLQLFNSLRLFHRAGYVHGDLKWENILARRMTTGFNVALADFEGSLRISQLLDEEFVATWQYMPISIVAHFLIERSNVPDVIETLEAGATKVVDIGLDFWALGILMLEHFAPRFMKEYEVEALVEQAQELDKQHTPAPCIQHLDRLRQLFVSVYDTRAYEAELPAEETPGNKLLKQVLRFCLQRPSNVGLHSAKERTQEEIDDLVDTFVRAYPLLPIDELDDYENEDEVDELASLVSEASSGSSFSIDSLRHPVRLPGNCQIIRYGTTWTMKVIGIIAATEADKTQTFELSSTKHAVGYPKLQPRYYCGGKDCSYSVVKWDIMVEHIRKTHSAACQQLKPTD